MRGMQQDSIKITQPAPYAMLKFVIQDGVDDFTSVHNIQFN